MRHNAPAFTVSIHNPSQSFPALTLVPNATHSPSFVPILVSFVNLLSIYQCSTYHASYAVLGMSVVNKTDTFLPSWTNISTLAHRMHHIAACPPSPPFLAVHPCCPEPHAHGILRTLRCVMPPSCQALSS